jgi:hypothetical protein
MKPQYSAVYLFLICFLVSCSHTDTYRATSTSTNSSPTLFPGLLNTNTLVPTPEPSDVLTLTPTREPTLTPTRKPTLTPSPTKVFTHLSELTQGQYLIFSIYDVDREKSSIGIVSANGFFQGFLTESLVESASISPNRRYLAFVYPDTLKDPYILDMENMQFTPIKFGDLFCIYPSWSPDGKQLALYCGSSEADITEDIYVFTVQSRSLERLSLCTDTINMCVDPKWSPDGKWIAYYRALGGAGISNLVGLYLIDTTCLNESWTCKQLEKGPFDVRAPFAWSPDSRFIASVLGKSIRIFEVGEQNVMETRDIDIDARADTITWSPDGNLVAYTVGNRLFILSQEGGKPFLLYEAPHIRLIAWIVLP